MPVIEFWFDFASTYSYPAAMRIERLAAERGVAVAWRAFLLGPIFAAQGLADSPFNLNAAKGRYMWRDIERVCAQEGLPFRRPSAFPRNSTLAARVACANEDAAWLPAFARAVYHANFAEDRDIGARDVIAGLLGELTLPAAEILNLAESPELRPRLREQTQTAAARGIFGAPTFFAGDEMFWGNDRLEAALKEGR